MKKMNLKKRIGVLAMVLLTICVMVTPVWAEQTGSLEIYIGNSGGKVTIYRVADSNLQFTNGFDQAGVSLDDLSDSSLPGKLQNAVTADTDSRSASAGTDKKVHFLDLQTGVYLVVQKEAASGYELFASFLVTIPIKEGDSWVYQVDASPKIELIQKPETPDEPDTSDTPETPDEPDTPDEPGTSESTIPKEDSSSPKQDTKTPEKEKIPQTGQLVWPIPVLAFAGMVMILVGKRLKNEEE